MILSLKLRTLTLLLLSACLALPCLAAALWLTRPELADGYSIEGGYVGAGLLGERAVSVHNPEMPEE